MVTLGFSQDFRKNFFSNIQQNFPQSTHLIFWNSFDFNTMVIISSFLSFQFWCYSTPFTCPHPSKAVIFNDDNKNMMVTTKELPFLYIYDKHSADHFSYMTFSLFVRIRGR